MESYFPATSCSDISLPPDGSSSSLGVGHLPSHSASRALDNIPAMNKVQEPSFLVILKFLPAQQDDAQQHYAHVRADNAAIQQSIAEVTSKVSTLFTEVAEMQQPVADAAEVGTATAKLIVSHDCYLALKQSKIKDLESCQRSNNLSVFRIPEGKEDDNSHENVVQMFGKAFPDLMDWDMDSKIPLALQLTLS
ncbi:hypothetical protein NDU88_012108 [Pleurodeles waltl]|uniref:Uncharacterized protein n=1 Tax=Pleurodeles waltl TaxID=8319 RepID=A0AAV7R121_PLEWA|nr:hypothetical protein NDU88_012108 [Pleurodeles waltl]